MHNCNHRYIQQEVEILGIILMSSPFVHHAMLNTLREQHCWAGYSFHMQWLYMTCNDNWRQLLLIACVFEWHIAVIVPNKCLAFFFLEILWLIASNNIFKNLNSTQACHIHQYKITKHLFAIKNLFLGFAWNCKYYCSELHMAWNNVPNRKF